MAVTSKRAPFLELGSYQTSRLCLTRQHTSSPGIAAGWYDLSATHSHKAKTRGQMHRGDIDPFRINGCGSHSLLQSRREYLHEIREVPDNFFCERGLFESARKVMMMCGPLDFNRPFCGADKIDFTFLR